MTKMNIEYRLTNAEPKGINPSCKCRCIGAQRRS